MGPSGAVEVLFVHAVTLGAVKVLNVVRPQNLVVCQIVLSFDPEEHLASDRELLL